MGMFPDDEEGEEIDDKFAEDILRKAIEGHSYVDVDDIADAYNWLVAHEQHVEARTVLEYGLDTHPENCKLLLIKALALVDQDELDKAERLLDYVEDEVEDKAGYFICRGWLSIKRNELLWHAEKFFDEAVKVVDDEMADIRISEIASNLVHMEKFFTSTKYFALISQEFLKNNLQTAFEYAYALSWNHDTVDKAIKLYEQITDWDPFYDSAWYNLAILYTKKGKTKEAIEAYTTCTDASPDYAEAYFNLGNIYLEQDDLWAAIDCYTEYLSLTQPDPEMRVYAYLGDCWIRLGNNDLAARIFTYVVHEDPDYDAAWYDLGRCNIELGRSGIAVINFQQAIDLNPKVSSYYFGLAQAFLNLGLQNKVIESLENGIRYSPDDVLAWFELVRMTFDFSNCSADEFNKFIEEKTEEFGSCRALQLVESYVEFFVFNNKRTAASLMRKVAKYGRQIILDAAAEPDLSKLFEQKGIARVLYDYNINLK